MSTEKKEDVMVTVFKALVTFILLFGIGLFLMSMFTYRVSIHPIKALFCFAAGVSGLIYLHKK